MSSLAFSEELGPPPGGLQKDTSPKPHSQWQPALTHIHSSPNALSSPNLPPLPPPASSLNVSAGLPSGVSPALRHASDLFLHHTSSPHILIQSNSIASLNKSFTRHPLLSPPAGARSTDISIPSGFSSRDLQNLWDEEAKMDPAVLSQEERDRDKDRLIAERNATHGKLGDGSKSGTSSKKGAASTGTINQEQIALRRRPAFISTVLSMHAIVHRKLYKATGLSVEVYFKNTWKVSRAQVYRLLDCASVLKQLECFPIEQQPHRERICRTLKRLSRNTVEMHALWRTVLSKIIPDQPITSTLIKKLYDELIEETELALNDGGGSTPGINTEAKQIPLSAPQQSSPALSISSRSLSGSTSPVKTARPIMAYPSQSLEQHSTAVLSERSASGTFPMFQKTVDQSLEHRDSVTTLNILDGDDGQNAGTYGFDQHLLHGNTTGREMESIDVDSMAGLLGISYSESLEAMSESFSQDMNSNMGSPSRRTSGSDEVNSFKEMEMDECMMFKQENADPTDVEMGACKIYTEESDGTQQALQNAVGKTDYKIDTSDLNLHGVDESHIFSAPTHSPSLSFKLEDLAYHRHGLDLDNGNSSTASPRIAALSPSSRLSLSLAALYTSPATAAAVTSSTTSAAKRWRRFSHSGEIVMRQAVAMASSFATHQPDTYTAMPSIGTSSAIDFGPLSTDEGPRLEGSSQFRQSKPMNETADFIGDSFETLEQEIKGKGMDFTCQYPPSLDSGKISQTFNEAECFSHGTSNLGLMSPSTNFRSTDEIPSTPWVHSHSVSSPAILPAAAASPFFSTAKTVAGAGNALPMRAKRRFSSTYTGEPYRQVLPGSGIQTATQSSKNHARTLSGSLHSIWSQDATDENHAPIGEVARAMLSRWSTAGGGSSSGTSSVSSIAGGREYPLRRSRFSSLVTPTSSISSGATPPIFDSPSSSFFADERTRSSSASSWVTASPASSFTETLSGLSLLSPSTNPSPGAAGIFAALGSTRNEMALSVAPPLNYLNHLLSPDISPIHGIGGDMEILHTYPNGSDVIFDFPNVESSDTSHTASSGKPFGISPHSKSWQLDQRPTHSTVGSESSELPCDGIEFHSNQMDEIALSSRLAAEHMTHNTNTYDASSQQGFLSHPFHGHPSPWYGAQISPAIQSCFIPNGEAGYNVGLDQHSNRVLPNAEIVGSPDGIVGD